MHENSNIIPTAEKKEGNLVLFLDSDWLTHELARMFGSIVFLHNFYAVKEKALLNELNSYEQHTAGWDIYRKANLYYYLESDEKLKIKEFNLPSPGTAEFTSRFLSYGQWLLSTLSIMRNSGQSIDNLVGKWYKFKDNLRKQRKKKKLDDVGEIINTFFSGEIIPFILTNESQAHEEEAIGSIKEGILLLYKSELTDPITTTDHLLTSFATLSYFVKANKILLDKSYIYA